MLGIRKEGTWLSRNETTGRRTFAAPRGCELAWWPGGCALRLRACLQYVPGWPCYDGQVLRSFAACRLSASEYLGSQAALVCPCMLVLCSGRTDGSSAVHTAQRAALIVVIAVLGEQIWGNWVAASVSRVWVGKCLARLAVCRIPFSSDAGNAGRGALE